MQSASTKILELQTALEAANNKYETEKNDCITLMAQNQRLQDLVTQAELASAESLRQSNEALDTIKKLEGKVSGLRKNGKCAKKTAMMTGATAMVGSFICVTVSRTVAAASLVGFGAGSLVNMIANDMTRAIRKRRSKKTEDTEESKGVINTESDAIMEEPALND